MRMACAFGALVFATAACGSSAAAPATTSTSAVAAACGPRDARTLVADSRARVFSRGGNVYGCARGVRHTYLLGRSSQSHPGQARIGALALAGVDVAYGASEMGVDTTSAEVLVRRLDDGRTIHIASATTRPLGPESFQTVDRLVVKPDGAVAWTATASSIIRHNQETEVDRIDRRGAATLDHGSGIAGQSLRLRGSRLTWRHGSETRAATLL